MTLPALLAKIVTRLPALGTILGTLAGGNDEAERIRAQAEADDLRGFHQTGRVSALHLWRYVKVGLAVLLAMVFCVALVVPGITANLVSLLDWFAEAVGKLFALGMMTP